MAVSVGPAEGEDEAISDINVVPLTDVMLVLLIVFLITTQVIKQAVPIKLPNVRYEPTTTKPENVSLTVRNGAGGTCEVITVEEWSYRSSSTSRRSRRSVSFMGAMRKSSRTRTSKREMRPSSDAYDPSARATLR